MKIRDQIQEKDFIFVLAEGKVTVQTKDLKGIRQPEWKETLQMHQLEEKLQSEFVPYRMSKNPITRPKLIKNQALLVLQFTELPASKHIKVQLQPEKWLSQPRAMEWSLHRVSLGGNKEQTISQ